MGVWEVIRFGWETFKDKTSLQLGLVRRVKFGRICAVEFVFEGRFLEPLFFRFIQRCLGNGCLGWGLLVSEF